MNRKIAIVAAAATVSAAGIFTYNVQSKGNSQGRSLSAKEAEGLRILEEMETKEIKMVQAELDFAENAKQMEEAVRKIEKARAVGVARRAAEEVRKAEEARRAAEEARKAEEARRAAEEARKAEEARRAAEEARKAEEARMAEAASDNVTQQSVENGTDDGSRPRNRNYKELFSNSIIMGDSVAEGILSGGFLYHSNVIAKKGISLVSLDGPIEKARSLYPQNVFLYYGFNDIGHCKGDLNKFRNQYEAFIIKLKTALPDANIYANAIFPVLEKYIIECGYYSETSAYNQVIQELCAEYGITYMDFTYLARRDLYAKDGYHFKKDFYPAWLSGMAEAAGL